MPARHERRHLLMAGPHEMRVALGSVERAQRPVDAVAGIAVVGWLPYDEANAEPPGQPPPFSLPELPDSTRLLSSAGRASRTLSRMSSVAPPITSSTTLARKIAFGSSV